jgi:hypothetical protein
VARRHRAEEDPPVALRDQRQRFFNRGDRFGIAAVTKQEVDPFDR